LEREHGAARVRREEIRRWLREFLPAERPDTMKPRTWDTLRAFADGDSLGKIAERAGFDRRWAANVVRHQAQLMGFDQAIDKSWLRPDGTLSPDSFKARPETGCLLWRGKRRRSEQEPHAYLPVSHREPDSPTPQGHLVRIRRFLWEREYGPLEAGQMVRATCGNWRCVALAHMAVEVIRTIGTMNP
jgi:hypothetical protein